MLQITVSRRHLLVFTAVVAVVVLVGWVVMSDRASATTSPFDDVPDSNVFESDINWLVDAGVTRGCNPPLNTKYCPSDYVTREQMSAFMHRLSGGDSRTIDGRLDALEAGGGASSSDLAALTTRLDTLETKMETLESENAALKALLAGVSRTGNLLLFSGVNLQVVNGEGTTGTSNGLGNIVIGYNDLPPAYAKGDRSGSHYLIIGDEHTYTAYAGIVAGYRNTATGPVSSVLGGRYNTATNWHASVVGGESNDATSIASTVTGGRSNDASGYYSSVSGGYSNDANGWYASVSGGEGNSTSEWYASILGGNAETVSSEHGTYPFCGCTP